MGIITTDRPACNATIRVNYAAMGRNAPSARWTTIATTIRISVLAMISIMTH